MFTFAYMDSEDSELMVVQTSTDADSMELAYEFSHRFPVVTASYCGEFSPREMAEKVIDEGFWYYQGRQAPGKKPRRFMKIIREYYGF